MMAADTSAIIAILNNEPESAAFLNAMLNDGQVLVSTATAVELLTVAMGKSDVVYQSAVEFLSRPFIRLVPPDEAQLWNMPAGPCAIIAAPTPIPARCSRAARTETISL